MASLYTFIQKSADSETTGSKTLDHYGNQPIDGAHEAIQGIGNGFQTTDATGTPNKSPLTVADNSVTTLLTPESAVQINFLVAGNTLNVSEVSTSMASYLTIPTGVQTVIDIANTSSLFLESNSGNATVSFWYTIV